MALTMQNHINVWNRLYNDRGEVTDARPIEEAGGLNLYGMVGNDSVNFLDVLGLANACETFTAKILDIADRACETQIAAQSSDDAFANMFHGMRKSMKELADYSVPVQNEKDLAKSFGRRKDAFGAPGTSDGVRDEITKGGQGAAAFRHIGLSAALVGAYGAIGTIGKRIGDKKDRGQYEDGQHTKDEAEAELGGNEVGLHVGIALRDYIKGCRCNKPDIKTLKMKLIGLMCDQATNQANGSQQIPVNFPQL